MKKILIILGLILGPIVMGGTVFLLSSRIVEEVEAVDPNEEIVSSDFNELFKLGSKYRSQRRFTTAGGCFRMALEHAETQQERLIAGREMGSLLFEDYRQGGESEAGAAALYLQAAYDCALEEHDRVEIGLMLLDIFQEMGDSEQFGGYLTEMLEKAQTPEQTIELWNRKFNYFIGKNGTWPQMNQALADAESLPLQNEEWDLMVRDMKLRTREKIISDKEWFNVYTHTMQIENPEVFREEVSAEIQAKLQKLIDYGSDKEREGALLRMSASLVASGNYDDGYYYLRHYLETEPSTNLTDALILLTKISRVRGQIAYAAQLAKSLLRRFDFDMHTREEVLQVTNLLEEQGLHEDALDLLEGCFSLNPDPIKEDAGLIGKAAILEEHVGRRANAVNYMNQLYTLDTDTVFSKSFSELINYNMNKSDYESVETWVLRFSDKLRPQTESYGNALYSLFEAKYWLDRPVLEQLFIGFSAVQHAPEDERTSSVELRLAGYIEDMSLTDLAVSYYNRIGLLNFFNGDSDDDAYSQNVGEQAMLGKARCLAKIEDWAAADRLYRDLCNRTQSPLVKSEAALGWAELALKFGQNKEAARRLDLSYKQMLSAEEQVRYSLGRSKLETETTISEPGVLEDELELLANLPKAEQRDATISFFNNTFDLLHAEGDKRTMRRIIDLAYQSEFTEWLPIQSYVLRLNEDNFERTKLAGLGPELRNKDEVAGASVIDLAESVDRIEKLAGLVERHKKQVIQ